MKHDWSRKMALAEVRRLKRRIADYEEECARAARDGYRPNTCIHGTNWWVDYDPICGACEDYGNTIPVYEYAANFARAREAEYMRRLELFVKAMAMQAPSDVGEPILRWIMAAQDPPRYLLPYMR